MVKNNSFSLHGWFLFCRNCTCNKPHKIKPVRIHEACRGDKFLSLQHMKHVVHMKGIVPLYNNVISVCIFIGGWPWSIKGHTHRWRQIHVNRLVFLFSCPKNPSINHLNFYCIKQIDYIFSVCVYCNRSQKTSQRLKNNSHSTSPRVLFCSSYAVTSSVIYYSTHTHGKM